MQISLLSYCVEDKSKKVEKVWADSDLLKDGGRAFKVTSGVIL